MNRKNPKGGGKKPRVEVVFDPDARKDYLTGFHKRKQARRRFGLAMQEIKDRKERLEERKERREALKERREELGLVQVDFEDGHTQACHEYVSDVGGVEGEHDTQIRWCEEQAVTPISPRGQEPHREGMFSVRRPDGWLRGGRVAGDSEGAKEERWSLAEVSKRLAANMPVKPRKGAAKRAAQAAAATTTDKGKKGKKARKA
ncbi:unnamed protein product, partial [Scytosiphon promiscuus]